MKHCNFDDLPRKHKVGAEGYEFVRRDFLRVHEAQSLVRIYEIPPGKSAYPYHYHLKNEETFFVLKGAGLLRTRKGEREVKPGDLLFFPGHVAMYLGEGRYIHSTGRSGDDGVVFNSLNPADPDYREDLHQKITQVGSFF